MHKWIRGFSEGTAWLPIFLVYPNWSKVFLHRLLIMPVLVPTHLMWSQLHQHHREAILIRHQLAPHGQTGQIHQTSETTKLKLVDLTRYPLHMKSPITQDRLLRHSSSNLHSRRFQKVLLEPQQNSTTLVSWSGKDHTVAQQCHILGRLQLSTRCSLCYLPWDQNPNQGQ